MYALASRGKTDGNRGTESFFLPLGRRAWCHFDIQARRGAFGLLARPRWEVFMAGGVVCLNPELPRDPGIKKLISALGLEGLGAWMLLICRSLPELIVRPPYTIEDLASWKSKDGRLQSALLRSGLASRDKVSGLIRLKSFSEPHLIVPPEEMVNPEAVLEAWNVLALRKGFAGCRRLHPSRYSKLKAWLGDPSWDWRGALARLEMDVPDIREVMERRARPHFLQGLYAEPQAWQASFDWFLRPGTVDRIIRGVALLPDPAMPDAPPEITGRAKLVGPPSRRRVVARPGAE